MQTQARKPTLAVHKFSSCDGCQLALLNLGPELLRLTELLDIVHFAEAGPVDEDATADIALVEGSISTAAERERIRHVRERSRYLVAIGACATAGGLQALRNVHDVQAWAADIYARPEHVEALDTATALAAHVRVDLELWGCPVNSRQVLAAVRSLLSGTVPAPDRDKLCLECKRRGTVCVVVAQGLPCMGPVTNTGCGVLCPTQGRDCYACYGPAENPNTASLAARFRMLGLDAGAVARRFRHINGGAPAFDQAARAEEG